MRSVKNKAVCNMKISPRLRERITLCIAKVTLIVFGPTVSIKTALFSVFEAWYKFFISKNHI